MKRWISAGSGDVNAVQAAFAATVIPAAVPSETRRRYVLDGTGANQPVRGADEDLWDSAAPKSSRMD